MVRHTLSVSDHFGTFCIKDSTTDLIGSAQYRHFDEDAENVFSREKLYTFN